MRRQWLLSGWMLLTISIHCNAWAGPQPPPGTLGLGVVLGEPSGLSAKYWHEKDRAIQGGLSYSFTNYFLAYADYLWHFFDTFSSRTSKFPEQISLYAGLGGVFLFATESSGGRKTTFTDPNFDFGVGLRIPLGVEWYLPRTPIALLLELVPGVGVIPAVYGFVGLGIGARYYF